MTHRIAVALGTALVLAGSALAESPAAKPVAPPPPPVLTVEPVPASGGTAADGWSLVPDLNNQFWARAEYMMAFFTGDPLPVLVTGSPVGTAQAAAGVPGQPATAVLFGGNLVNDNYRSGFRFETGYFFTPEQCFGIEAGTMMIESQAAGFIGTSATNPILGRPYVDVSTTLPAAVLVSFPGLTSGDLTVRAESGNLYEAHIDLSEKLCDKNGIRVDSLIGYRFYRYDEGLRFREVMAPTSATFVPGTLIQASEGFTTHNEFHGVDLGLRTKFEFDRFDVGFLAKVAMGNLDREVGINGGQVVTVPGSAPIVSVGNLYALGTNIGNHHQNDFAAFPEFGVTFCWKVNTNTRVSLGYSLFGLTQIARAANQVDQRVNTALLPPAQATTGPQLPGFSLNKNDIWINSMNIGVEFRF